MNNPTLFDLQPGPPAPVDVPRRFSVAVQALNPPDPPDLSEWGKQLQSVYRVMKCGRWFTLAEVAYHAGCPEASASARIRDLDNQKGIAHEKRRQAKGLVEYRLILPAASCSPS